MMASFMRVSYKLVFHQSKCISAINRIHSTAATHISSSSAIYLCIPCYYDACLKSSAMRVGVKTLHNTMLVIIIIQRSIKVFITKYEGFSFLENLMGFINFGDRFEISAPNIAKSLLDTNVRNFALNI